MRAALIYYRVVIPTITQISSFNGKTSIIETAINKQENALNVIAKR
jgi:hypothetical protein